MFTKTVMVTVIVNTEEMTIVIVMAMAMMMVTVMVTVIVTVSIWRLHDYMNVLSFLHRPFNSNPLIVFLNLTVIYSIKKLIGRRVRSGHG